MATAQSMPVQGDPNADPDEMVGGADPDETQQPQDDGSYVIEIRVSSSKEITVCVEPGAEEAQEEGAEDGSGGGDTDDNSVPVKSIKEALTLCLEIFRGDGELPQQADDQFQQGFQGANS